MAIAKIIYVDPDASGSADGTSWTDAYTSLQTAQSTEATDITGTAGDYLFLCRASGGTADTTLVDFDTNWVTDGTHRVIFRANTGDEAIKTGWDNTRYRLSVDDDQALLFQYGDTTHLEVDGLQISSNVIAQTNKTAFWIGIVGLGTEIYVKNCRIRAYYAAGAAKYNHPVKIEDADATVHMWNNIIDCESGVDGIEITNGTLNLYNSIIYGAGTNGIEISAGVTATIKNCSIFECGDDINDSASSTIDYCATDDGDGTNSISASGGNWDNEYNDPANDDFTLLNTGNCYHAGADLSGTFTTDMEGDTYNTGADGSAFSVGVDEYVLIIVNNIRNRLKNALGGFL